MDINQLRGSADLWDKIMIISVIVTAVVVAATGASTWLSIKCNSALRVKESAAIDRYKVEAADHAATLEKVIALTKVRTCPCSKCASASADEE
jgi:hypothetical protein